MKLAAHSRAAIAVLAALGLTACTHSSSKAVESTIPVQKVDAIATAGARRQFFKRAPYVYALHDKNFYAVPQTIDRKYVVNVVHVFDHLNGEAIRVAKADPKNATHSRAFKDLLVATNSSDYFHTTLDKWDYRVDQDPDLSRFKKKSGDYNSFVERVVRAGPSCLVVQVETRGNNVFSKNFKTKFPKPNFMAFVPRSASANYSLNPAPWLLNYWGGAEKGNEPKDACAVK